MEIVDANARRPYPPHAYLQGEALAAGAGAGLLVTGLRFALLQSRVWPAQGRPEEGATGHSSLPTTLGFVRFVALYGLPAMWAC